jgi:diphthine-ammonia ligase
MKIAALVSGGKDSIYAAYKSSKENEIVCIISFRSKRNDSYMFHIPNIHLVELQAKAMGIPLIFVESSGIKEKELKDIEQALKAAIKKYKIEGVVSGALASNYQKERIDKICRDLEIKSIAPLWQINPKKYIKELIDSDFKIILTGIAAEGLTRDFLGQEINDIFLDKIKDMHIHHGGEGGEYESLVIDCPMFSKKLKINRAKVEMENDCTGQYIVVDAELEEK